MLNNAIFVDGHAGSVSGQDLRITKLAGYAYYNPFYAYYGSHDHVYRKYSWLY